jgi:predicted dinucleotide-binding enzyme
MSKKVGILGSGAVGKRLAEGFLKYGYEVMVGTRDTAKLTEWQAEAGKGAHLGSFEQTATFGDMVVLAVKGRHAESALNMAGAENLNGKTVIDATNPIADTPPTNGVLAFFTTHDNSLMEQLQGKFPDANFVKSFSCVGSAFMVDPPFPQKPSMFICGNDEKAKIEVKEVLIKFGWEIEDMGKVEAARAIEPLCMLWCIPGFASNQWTHAFRLMKL